MELFALIFFFMVIIIAGFLSFKQNKEVNFKIDYNKIPLEDIQHINKELSEILDKMQVHESVLKQYRSKDNESKKKDK